MKHYEKKTDVLSSKTCDICGEQVNHHTNFKYGDTLYDECEIWFEIKLTENNWGPDGSIGKTLEPDICTKCMITKILPYLESLMNREVWEDFDTC